MIAEHEFKTGDTIFRCGAAQGQLVDGLAVQGATQMDLLELEWFISGIHQFAGHTQPVTSASGW